MPTTLYVSSTVLGAHAAQAARFRLTLVTNVSDPPAIGGKRHPAKPNSTALATPSIVIEILLDDDPRDRHRFRPKPRPRRSWLPPSGRPPRGRPRRRARPDRLPRSFRSLRMPVKEREPKRSPEDHANFGSSHARPHRPALPMRGYHRPIARLPDDVSATASSLPCSPIGLTSRTSRSFGAITAAGRPSTFC